MGFKEILSKIKYKKGNELNELNEFNGIANNKVELETETINYVEEVSKIETINFYKFEINIIDSVSVFDISFKPTNMILEYDTNEISIDLTKKYIKLVEEKHIPMLFIEDDIDDINNSISGLLDEEYSIKSIGIEFLDKIGNIVNYNFSPIELIEGNKIPKGAMFLKGDVKIGYSIHRRKVDYDDNIDIFLINKPHKYNKELSYIFYNNTNEDGFMLNRNLDSDNFFSNKLPKINEAILFNVNDISSYGFDIYFSCYGDANFNDVYQITLYIENNNDELYMLNFNIDEINQNENTRSIKLCTVENLNGDYILNKNIFTTTQRMDSLII